MEEYNFIKNITETVLNKIYYYNNNKIKPMLELLIDKLYNYEDNLEQINENINDIYNIYITNIYNFGDNIDNYDLLNINISEFTYDTQLSILIIRLTNYIEYLNKKRPNTKWYNFFLYENKISHDTIEQLLGELDNILKKNRHSIIQNYLLLLECKNNITLLKEYHFNNIDIPINEHTEDDIITYYSPSYNLIILRILFNMLDNIAIKKS